MVASGRVPAEGLTPRTFPLLTWPRRAAPHRVRVMRQLTSLDAQFLALENSRQTGHVGSLALLDASTTPDGSFGCGDVTRLIDERAPQLPPLRWRLAEVPLGLDHPYWVEEAEIDL